MGDRARARPPVNKAPTHRHRDLGARAADAVRDADPFAFGANATALFEDVDAETLAEEDDDDDEKEENARVGAKRGVGVSVFEKVRREKASAAAKATKAVGEKKTNGTAKAKAKAREDDDDAFDDPPEPVVVDVVEATKEKGKGGRGDGDGDDDDVVLVADDEPTARPAEDLFDEVSAPSPNTKRATRAPKTLSRAIAKKRAQTAAATNDESSNAPSTSRPVGSASAPAPAPAAKRKKVTLKEFAGEEEEEDYGARDHDEFGAMMPRSGAQLADIDEANYAVSGLSSVRDVKEKIRSVGVLVNLLGNQRTRRLLTSYGLPIKIVRAAQDAAMSAHAPKTLQFGASALLYLAAGELKPPASDALLTVKSADAIRALLRPVSAGDDAAHAQTNAAVRACLKPLKFLPYETKDAQTLALLIAHRALKGEQDAVLASGSGPGAGDAENCFRTVLANRGGVLAACELVAQATSTLQNFGAACMSSSEDGDGDAEAHDDDDATIAEHEQAAARAVARLFRCLRVLECASFESPASCSVITSAPLTGAKKNAPAVATHSSIELIPVVDGRGDRAQGRVVPSAARVDAASTPSPAECRFPGGMAMTPPSTPGAIAVVAKENDEDDVGVTPLSSPVPIGLLRNKMDGEAKGATIQWLAENVRTPVKGGSPNARTACRALVETLPTLAAATVAAVVGAKKGEYVGDVKIRYDGAIAIDHRVAVGTLKSALCALANVTNENEEGCNAVVGDDGRGLLVIASLVPFLARTIEGYSLEDASDRRRSRTPADDSGSSLLAATLVLLVNIVEADSTTAETLRTTFVRLGGGRGRKTASASARTQTSFVDALAALYLQAGGADDVEADSTQTERSTDVVTADMVKAYSSKTNGDDLILQAYTGLLLAFLIENQPAWRADVVARFPGNDRDGYKSLKPLADTLERFHAFHESLNSISARSSDRLERVVAWLRG